MKERIRQILEWTNLSQQDFANQLGISPASLSSIFTGRTNPTNNHVQAIHRSFPAINVSWLLFGEGQMMNAESSNPVDETSISSGVNNQVTDSSSGMMASMFSEEDYDDPSKRENQIINHSSSRRENTSGRTVGFRYSENTKNLDIKPRKIKEIRVFFDDGTYEAFVPSGSK